MVVCCQKALAGWKRRAAKKVGPNTEGRSKGCEYMELLFGESRAGIRYILKFVTLPQKATRNWVEPTLNDEAYVLFIGQCESKLGLDWLGTIHTHLWECHGPSDADNTGAIEDDEQVFAIDTILKPKGRQRCSHSIEWYEPQNPIDTVVLV